MKERQTCAGKWPPLAPVKKQYTAKYLKEAVALCNAARRAGAFDLERPLQHLLHDEGPRPLAQDEVLAGYRAAVAAELTGARKLPLGTFCRFAT